MLDYCNVILIGLPASILAPLWRALHAAARLVLDLRPCDHMTQALQELHWLPIMQRINYKLYLLVHKSRTGRAPVYVSDMLTPAANYTTAVVAVIMRSSCGQVNTQLTRHTARILWKSTRHTHSIDLMFKKLVKHRTVWRVDLQLGSCLGRKDIGKLTAFCSVALFILKQQLSNLCHIWSQLVTNVR